MRIFTTLIVLLLMSPFTFGQDFFKLIEEDAIPKEAKKSRSIVPLKYQVFELNMEEMQTSLKSKGFENRSIQIINPEGQKAEFIIREVKMMEDGLSKKFPGIQTFIGYAKENRAQKIHLGISSTGFYATISGPGEQYSIDRFSDKQTQYYISYYIKDHINLSAQNHTCGTEELAKKTENNIATSRNPTATLPLRTYRFAVATTGEFGAFYGPSKEDVLGEIMKSVNRMNQVLENDFAIRLVLIADNDKLIWTDADTDPYPDGNSGGTLLGQNTGVLASNVGINSFDIGHVYTRGCNDTGGIAFIESACAANKGGGVTCHYSNDITAMAIRVAAHEVGHQLGANHTFNNCSGNERPSTAYEPGSGTTIMSYGGLCGPELNVINVADDYFHVVSIMEVTTYSRLLFGNSCAELVTTSNNIPDVSIPLENGFYIPVSTPFALTGEAIDLEDDPLTYTWEQFNLGPSTVPGNPQANSPLFVSTYPDTSATRYFPRMETIVANITDKREVLPTYDRDLNFQFVVRDNNPESGAVAWEEISFNSTSTAGPFVINYPSQKDTFNVGEEIEILWDVANTDQSLVNCQAVNILISTDGGYTYDHAIVEQTPNDGSERIFLPNLVGNSARIKVEAADNIFFDISNEDFVILPPSEPGFLFTYSPSYINHCVQDDAVITLETESLLNYDEPISFSIVNGLIDGVEVVFSNEAILPGESTTANIIFNDKSLTGSLSLEFEAISAADTLRRQIELELTSSDFSDIKSITPLSGSSGNVVAPIFTWQPDSDADEYVFKLSDNPSFEFGSSEILYNETIQDTFFELDDILDKSSVYYWTVLGKNNCGTQVDAEIFTFGTEALSCNTYDYNDVPVGISQSGVITVELPIDIIAGGQVTDVNVTKIRGSHTWVSELKGELVSPSGVSVLLFNKKCGNQANFNAGFDDDAVGEVTCPLNQGVFYKPEERLDTFLGEEISGTWTFRMTDMAVGNGGSIQEYKLEVCSNEALAGPIIVENNTMPLPMGVGRRISPEFLLAQDENNAADELLYTIVKIPENGELKLEEQDLAVGGQFTQLDIDNMRLRYLHNGQGVVDSFTFVVEDGEGGWIDQTSFEIVIDDNEILDVEEVIIPEYVLFPNPSKGNFQVQFDSYTGSVQFSVLDIMGRKVQHSIQGGQQEYQISMEEATSGIYIVEMIGEGFRAIRKVFVE